VVALLVLLSALLHAMWNALLKTERDKDVAGAAVVAMNAVIAFAAALVVWAIERAPQFPLPGALLWSAGAGLFEGIYFVFLLLALERAPLAVAYTVSRGLAILAVWPLSIALLDEEVTAVALVGTALLCLGLAANAMGKGRGSARGILFACLCGLSIAGYHMCYKQALSTGAAPTAVFALAMALAWPLNMIRLGRDGLGVLGRALRARPAMLSFLGGLTTASFLLFLLALAQSGAGFVITLRNTSIVFAALIGWSLGESPTRQQLLGAILVTVGAVLVGMSS
jgi:drug/metabolite transporter (DMT)-like permease